MTNPTVPFTFHLGSPAAATPGRKSPSVGHTPQVASRNAVSTPQPAATRNASRPDTSVKQEESSEDPLVVAMRGQHATTIQGLMDLFEQAIGYQSDHARMDGLQQELEVWKTQYFEKAKAVSAIEVELQQLRERERLASGSAAQLKEEQDNLSLFSAVLLDGDGLIFAHNLMSQGALGGREAARLLLSALPSIISSKLPHKAKIQSKILGKVLVIVFINKTGLSNTLVKAGIVSSHAMFNDFYNGLSQAHDLFSVVDVGLGKEASDAKMREYLRLYAANAQCGMILLGASHDNGYAPILSSLATEGRLGNVLLLKGYNSVAFELQQYKHLTVEIPGLFRSEKVVIIPGSFENKPFLSSTPKKVGPIAILKGKTKAKASGVGTASTARGGGAVSASDDSDHVTTEGEDSEDLDAGERAADGKQMIVDEDDDSDDLAAHVRKLAVSGKKGAAVSTPRPAATKPPASGLHSRPQRSQQGLYLSMKLTEDNGWVGVKTPKAGAGAPPATKVFSPIIGGPNDVEGTPTRKTKAGGKQPKTVKVEGSEHVVRTLNPRPCHKEYLTEEGCDNVHCSFGHNYDLSKGQMALLRKLVSEMPCPFFKIGRCSSVDGQDCIYGHVCPQKNDCRWGVSCRFRELPGGGH